VTELEGINGHRFRIRAPGLEVGRTVAFALRADHLELEHAAALKMAVGADAAPSTTAANAMSGRVASVQYQGTHVDVRVAVDGLEPLQVTVPEAAFYAAPFAVGAPARVCFAPSEAQVVHG